MVKINEMIKNKTEELKSNIKCICKEIEKLNMNKNEVKTIFDEFQLLKDYNENSVGSDYLNDQLDELVIFTEKLNVETEIVDIDNLKFKLKNNTIFPEYMLIDLFVDSNYENIIKLVSMKYDLEIPRVLDIFETEINSLKLDEAYYPYEMKDAMLNIQKELDSFVSYFIFNNLKEEVSEVLNLLKVQDEISNL